MIQVLYFNPTAQVLTGQWFSIPFPVTRSSRQGCPLCPSLFALSLEPLVQMIRQSTSINPISILNTEHKVALFADDVLVFMENPILLSICEEFGSHSGFKINWSKSALLPLNDSAKTVRDCVGVEVKERTQVHNVRMKRL